MKQSSSSWTANSMYEYPRRKLNKAHGFVDDKPANQNPASLTKPIRILIYLWVLPTSAVATPLILLNLISGGQTFTDKGVMEVEGRLVSWFLRRRLVNAAAITFGHIILYADSQARETYRAHEMVHVEQAERWGPFFLPCYLAIALLQWCRSGRGYWDHPWEVEARNRAGI
ncbi:MAG: hypothetical protein ACKO0V_16715 [bacterium]